MIYSENDSALLLGILMNDSTKCLDTKYPLDKEDFECVLFHRTLYATIYNLAIKGVKQVDEIMVEEFLHNYPAQEQIYLDSNGRDFIFSMKELSYDKVENIQYYWEIVRKHSMLREYEKSGTNIKEIWDNEKSDIKNEEELNKWTIDEICNGFEAKQVTIRRKFLCNKVKEEYTAGTDFLEYKERFKKEPLIGNSFQSPYLNGIYRGIFGFIIRVAKSGGGKSILSLGDLCKTTVTEYWDYETQSFVTNKSRVGSGLFINTELELREELDPIIIAWISGVNRSHIVDGKYEEGEEDRVDYAYHILIESELYIVDDPDFTARSLTETIKDYHLRKNVQTVCFDYISVNSNLIKELTSETKIPQREDQILLTLTDRLKQIQRECGISLISSVQSNGQEDNMEYPTEACLAGGKSQVRKTNGTMAMFPPTKKELEQTSMILQKKGFGTNIYPNNVCHIIKGRNSKYAKYIKVFQYMDLGTGRTIDLYCTDKYNKPLKVDKLYIERNDYM